MDIPNIKENICVPSKYNPGEGCRISNGIALNISHRAIPFEILVGIRKIAEGGSLIKDLWRSGGSR